MNQSPQIQISVITVTWSSAGLIGQQIESVQKGCKNITCEQIIIDNASPDNTVAFIKENHPEVTLIANTENKGFGKANNQGVDIARGKFLLFLNPDMRVAPDSLDVMYNWMKDHPEVGIVSPKLVDENGKLNEDAQPRRFPRLWEQLALILKLPHIFPRLLDGYMLKGFNADKEQEVDSVRGSFMLMRREFVNKLGFAWDPRYYIWYEDVDICREAKRLGYKVMHTPVISCTDYIGQSFKKRDTLWKQRNFTSSMLTYYKKWEPWYKWMWIALFKPVGIAMASLNDAVHKMKNKK
jgi:GT2 family glycosyltransferase